MAVNRDVKMNGGVCEYMHPRHAKISRKDPLQLKHHSKSLPFKLVQRKLILLLLKTGTQNVQHKCPFGGAAHKKVFD